MSKEIRLSGGFVNDVTLNSENNRVRKYYRSGNGIQVDPETRLQSELESLNTFNFAPNLLGESAEFLEMEYVEGEKQLDLSIRSYSEAAKKSVLTKTGEMLSLIHSNKLGSVTETFHLLHRNYYLKLVENLKTPLNQQGISTQNTIDFLSNTYDREVIEVAGLVWTHGDYWLNNIIGSLHGDNFTIHKVIDWELSGVHSPYRDYSTVYWSIEEAHLVSDPIWLGYKKKPDEVVKKHFSTIKLMEWLDGENGELDLESPFYKPKVAILKKWLS